MAKKLSKSEHIRRFLAHNPDAKPKQIKEALAKRNIEVTDALVSVVKYSKAGPKAAGRRKKTTKARRRATNGRRKARKATAVDISDLVAAKHVAEKLGGIDAAKRALEMLSRIQS